MSLQIPHSAAGCCPVCGTEFAQSAPAADKLELTFLIRENKKFVKIRTKNIEVIEGMKDYVKIYIKNKVIVTHMTMSKLEEMLDKQQFWRVNRSFIIKKTCISSITYSEIEMSNKMIIPIGINYRNFIKDIINTGFL